MEAAKANPSFPERSVRVRTLFLPVARAGRKGGARQSGFFDRECPSGPYRLFRDKIVAFLPAEMRDIDGRDRIVRQYPDNGPCRASKQNLAQPEGRQRASQAARVYGHGIGHRRHG